MTQEELDQVESSQRQHHEVMRHQSDISFYVEKEEYNLFSMLKPKLFVDGDQWCCLFGKNLQEGIAGFGDTPHNAIIAFNGEWHKPITEKVKS